MRRKMHSLSWESRKRILTRKSAPLVYFGISREATVEKIKLRIEAFGRILAFFHRESDFNRNQTGDKSNKIKNEGQMANKIKISLALGARKKDTM
jgi:hypothetical protein